MGATEFYSTVRNEPNIDAAFRQARREALEYEGSRGYTGTIAEKTNYRLIATVDTHDEADDMAYQMIQNEDPRINDKWGPAGAIKFTDNGQTCWMFVGIAPC